jgi:phosphotransferase system IIA component
LKSIPGTAASSNIQQVLKVNDRWFARHNIGTGTVIRTDKGSLAETFFRH